MCVSVYLVANRPDEWISGLKIEIAKEQKSGKMSEQ